MKKELIDEAVRLVEETHNDDIGTADFSFNKLIKTFEELPTVSLLREVATTVPMKMSTATSSIFAEMPVPIPLKR